MRQINKTHYTMKTLKQLLLLCALVALAACSEDAFVPSSEVAPSSEDNYVNLFSMTVPDVELTDATTRSILYEDGDQLKFAWQWDDAIAVVPQTGHPLRFPIDVETIQGNTALFDGSSWALRTDTKYAAFFPYDKNLADKYLWGIPVDYRGQTQTNYMKYDYLAAGAVQPKDGAVKFDMKRLSAILKIQVYIPSQKHFQYITLIAPEPLFTVKGQVDLNDSAPTISKVKEMSKFISTDLTMDKTSTGANYTFYLMIPPTDLNGTTLSFRITSDSGDAMQATFTGKNFEAEKAYFIDAGLASDAMITNENLIEAAGLSSVAGSSGVSVSDNLDRILQVTTIDVSDKGDETVCDEIGFFRNLKILNCSNNGIRSLDLSNNLALESLSCGDNQLTSLDVSKNKS